MSHQKSKTSPGTVPVREESTLDRVKRYLQQGQYAQALQLVGHPGPDLTIKNAKGVCLMRLGQYEAAVSVYRDIVFKPGCVWVRPEIPTVYKVNFATALLLAKNLDGCRDMLNQAMDENNPGVKRLRACLRRWSNGLTLWQRVARMFGQKDEKRDQVPLDFEPGLFEDAVIFDRISSATTPETGNRPSE